MIVIGLEPDGKGSTVQPSAVTTPHLTYPQIREMRVPVTAIEASEETYIRFR